MISFHWCSILNSCKNIPYTYKLFEKYYKFNLVNHIFNHSIYSKTEKEKLNDNLSKKAIQINDGLLISENVKSIGWIQSIRRHKSRVFIDISDGTSPYNLQVVASPDIIPENTIVGCAISVVGNVYKSNYFNQKSNDSINQQYSSELQATHISLFNRNEINASKEKIIVESDGIIGKNIPRPNLGLLRSSNTLAIRHRLPEFGALLRMRTRIKSLFHKVMSNCEYLEVDTPILTTTDCEGTGQMFKVIAPNETSGDHPSSLSLKSNPIYLTGSAQLHLEALTLGLSKVYTLGPTFRAEKSHTRHHLAEFYMLEAESVNLDTIDKLCTEIELIVRMLLEECLKLFQSNNNEMNDELSDIQYDLLLIHNYLSDPNNDQSLSSYYFTNKYGNKICDKYIKQIETILNQSFLRLTYNEAIDYLNKNFYKTNHKTLISDLNKFDEHNLLNGIGNNNCPLFILNYPIELKAFYCESLDKQYAQCCDLLFPGIGELIGASLRETDLDKLTKRLQQLYNDKIPDSLDWYINLRQLGNVTHSGFGLGFERFLQFILGIHNIKDTIAFPRTIDKIVL